MDVDNDVDQNLLMQFSCMGTTDKDELIKQLQTLLGYQLNSTAASFFLEMNNWNLQGAVGSYFDAYNSIKLPSMILLRDFNTPEIETRVHPGTSFFKSWELENPGEEPWPAGCCLQFTGGKRMTEQERFPVVELGPGCRTTLRLDMVAPNEPGIYENKWRMSNSSGSFFGDVIWVIVTVCDQTLNGLTQQLSGFRPLSSSNTDSSSPNKPQSGYHSNADEDGNMLC